MFAAKPAQPLGMLLRTFALRHGTVLCPWMGCNVTHAPREERVPYIHVRASRHVRASCQGVPPAMGTQHFRRAPTCPYMYVHAV